MNDLSSKYKVILVQGIGGIGKTQLLLQFFKKNQVEVFWFNLEKYNTLKDFQLEFLSRFDATSTEALILTLNETLPKLVFDGFEKFLTDEWENAVLFLENLCRFTENVQIFISSQIDFVNETIGAGTLKLEDGLNEQEGFSILNKNRTSDPLQNDSIKQLYNFSDGHPLTLSILQGMIQFLGDSKKVLNTISTTGIKTLENPKSRTQTKETSLKICLTTVYEIVNEEYKALLFYLTNFPGGCKTDYLKMLVNSEKAPITFLSDYELNKAVATLNQFNFLQSEDDFLGFNRIFILNPIRLFIKDKAHQKSKQESHHIKIYAFQNLMIEAVILYDRYMLSNEIGYAIARYELELPNYLNAFRSSLHSAYCNKCQQYSDKDTYLHIITGLTAGLYKFFFTRGYFDYSIYFNREGAKAHIELGEYDLAIDDLSLVATTYWRLYNNKEYENVLRKAQDCEIKSNKRFAAVRLLEGHFFANNDPEKAIKIFEEGISICKVELNKGYSDSAFGNMAGLISEIGRIYETKYRDEKKALTYYKRGYYIQKKMKDYTNMYCNSHHLGNCYDGIGDYNRAIKYYKEALKGFVKFGQGQYIGNSLSELGRMRLQHNDLNFGFLNRKLLLSGLIDIQEEISLTLKTSLEVPFVYGHIHYEQIHKLWNIIKIVSLSKHSDLLYQWSEDLMEILINNDPLNQQPTYPLLFLKIAMLSTLLEDSPNDSELMDELKETCNLYGSEIEHDRFDPFEWLALWLREKNIDTNATRGSLLGEVESKNGYFGW